MKNVAEICPREVLQGQYVPRVHMMPVLGARFASFLGSQPYYSTNHFFQTFCPTRRTGHHTTFQQAGN